MAAVAKPLNEAQIEAVAAYYASLQPYQHAADFKNPYAWVMKAVVENWSDEDLNAVAAYVSGLGRR